MGQLPVERNSRFQTQLAFPKYEEVVAIAETLTRMQLKK
jgi:hypothetical protein